MSDLQDFVFLFAYLPFIIFLHFSLHCLHNICEVKGQQTSGWTEPWPEDLGLAHPFLLCSAKMCELGHVPHLRASAAASL